MSMLKEFKDFAMKGNVVDMAVGIIIGGAFGKIVSSLVADVVMPPIGVLLGGVNFNHLKVTLKEGAENVPAVTLNYGAFVQVTIDFLIVAAALFALIKLMNTLRRNEEAKPAPAKPDDEVLLGEIRDLLKERR